VPLLSESIYSLLQHIKQPNHVLHSSFETGLHVSFPGFQTKAIVGKDDIYLNFLPASDTLGVNDTSGFPGTMSQEVNDSVCCHITDVTSGDAIVTKDMDNLLTSLHQHYATVKMKRQLNLDVPVGFRQATNLQTLFRSFTPPRKSKSTITDSSLQPSNSSIGLLSKIQSTDSSIRDIEDVPTSIPKTSSSVHVPILRCVDKISTSLPSRLTLTEDFIRASVGFRRIDSIKQHLRTLYQNTIDLDSTPPDAVLDLRDCATIWKAPRNTTPAPRPSHFGDVIHMDIVFGPDISIGNIHYGLLFTDRYSRMTYIYPLQNLT
jgi:hypothetical protein